MARVSVTDDGGDTMDMVDFGDLLGPGFKQPKQCLELFKNIPHLELRDDDVMLCTYMKTGTNWTFELMSMLLEKTSKRQTDSSKLFTMIDLLNEEEINNVPSPRILNTHFAPKYLPRSMKTKKTKTVLCLRNPKDTAISHFHHIKSFKPYHYNGKFENFVRPWAVGKFEYGAYSDYLNQWQTTIEEGPGFPLHIMYFEDLKLNGLQELNRLAKFLDIDIDDTLKQEIVHMCHFDKMAKEKTSFPDSFVSLTMKEAVKAVPPEVKESLMKMKPAEVRDTLITAPEFSFYRKGLIGDWKNTFTVAQNDMFDTIWNRDIRNDTIFKFKYSQ